MCSSDGKLGILAESAGKTSAASVPIEFPSQTQLQYLLLLLAQGAVSDTVGSALISAYC